MLIKLRNILGDQLIVYSYYAFSIPIYYIEFCFGETLQVENLFILKWQKGAITNMLGFNLRELCKEHFRTLQILTVPCIYIFNCLVYVKKNLNNLSIVNQFIPTVLETLKNIYLPYY